MYQFKNLIDLVVDTHESSFGLIFNGKYIEQEISGFMTLVVSGRGLVGREIKTSSAPGADGENLDYSNLPGRMIDVKFRLTAEDSSSLRRKYERLNTLLHTKTAKAIQFRDDPTRHFKGILSGISEEEETSNTIKGEISFYCPTPFKYSDPITKSGTSILLPGGDNAYKVLADFSFVPTAPAALVRIFNGYGESIAIGPVVAGATYKLTTSTDRVEVKENGIKKMTLLSIEAGVETFRIEPDLVFTLSTVGVLTGNFLELRL